MSEQLSRTPSSERPERSGLRPLGEIIFAQKYLTKEVAEYQEVAQEHSLTPEWLKELKKYPGAKLIIDTMKQRGREDGLAFALQGNTIGYGQATSDNTAADSPVALRSQSEIRTAQTIIGEKVAKLEHDINLATLSNEEIRFIGANMEKFTLAQEMSTRRGMLDGVNFVLGAENTIAKAVNKRRIVAKYVSPHP